MLELTSVSKAYDGFEFGPVDLAIDDEVLSVLGPSGSGKTTLLTVIAGIVRPDTGSVSLNGRALDGRAIQERRTGLVFQHGALFPHMTVRENVGYAATADGRVEELAALLEITDVLDRRPPTLSGGERQRVALARTLAAEPDALLLDEPLSSLDTPIRRRLRGDLRALFESLAMPVVYVTHDQRTATALGDRTAIFRDGVVEQVGSPSDVLRRPATRFVARFTGNENLFEATVAGRTGDALALRIDDVTLRTTAAAGPGSAVTACIHPSRVRLHAPDDAADTPANTLHGTVRHWLNEGDEYRVELDVTGASLALVATVQPPAFERLAIDADAGVRIAIPPDAIHLIR